MIEKHEMKAIKSLEEPSIKLIGFKPRTSLKDYHNLKHSSFIYPDEAAVRGSSVVYACLLQKMLEMDKIAICKMTARAGTSLRLVALVPFRELVKDGIQVYPAGLYVIYLPFADDIREDKKEEETPKSTEAQRLAAVALVRKLRIEDFDCRNFDNPVLQHHYMTLEAIALDRDEAELEIPEDTVEPDMEGIERQSAVLNAFRDACFPSNYTIPDPKVTPGKKAPTKKRTREDGELFDDDDPEGPTAKKRKLVEAMDWSGLAASGALAKCTLDQLKAYCASKGLKGYSTLKKAQLVETVQNHIAESTPKTE
jgi:ATP-dependent DNA helicase 2 subunit 1